jgi:non-specific serine/threonine protein kinase
MAPPRPSPIGELLKSLRLAAGMTQIQLGDKAGLSARGVSDIERGLKKRPHRQTLVRLADALQLAPLQRSLLEQATTIGLINARSDESIRPSHGDAEADRRHNLPSQLSSFVGREREIGELGALLHPDSGYPRLLTLTGTGGVGKTRLALEVASRVLPSYPDGVWLVELATLVEPKLILQAVAAALGVREDAERDLDEMLVESLGPRQVLLLLDNCEHLIDACAERVTFLLGRCPRLRILVTSRETLGLPGELVWRVPSLQTPSPEQLAETRETPVDAIEQMDSVRLFVERARQSIASFQVTVDNAKALAHICHQLDGIPLAIELAAARMVTHSPDQLAARLDRRFSLLTRGNRNDLPQHQTLRATVDWSYDLLSASEQRLFRRLAVFAGGWTLEAAEAVCGDEGVGFRVTGLGESAHPQLPFPDTRNLAPDTPPSVLDLLSALVDKSLVDVETKAGNAARYRLLETLREYALEHLRASDDLKTARRAHANYYVALGNDLGEAVLGNSLLLSAVFRPEIDNFRAALDWYAETEDWTRCLELVGSLSNAWWSGGQVSEASRWLDLALQHERDVAPARRGRVLLGIGTMAFGRGDYSTAISSLGEAIRLFREQGDEAGLARAQVTLGHVLRDRGCLAEAAELLEDGLRASQNVGDRQLVVRAMSNLGFLARQQGDPHRAEALLVEALQRSREAGFVGALEITILQNLTLVAEDRGEIERAWVWHRQSGAMMQRAGLWYFLPFFLEGSMTLLVAMGFTERGIILGGAAAAIRERAGSPLPPILQIRLSEALARARQDLGATTDDAWSRGRAMTADQAMAYALADPGR